MSDLTGMKFGRLTVDSFAGYNVTPGGYKCKMWNCTCDCGNKVTVRGKSLTGGVTRSCGCYQRECISERASKHNGFGSRLYAVWNSMRQRCNNPNNHAYANYGGRGISICKEWDDYAVFREWALSSGYDESAIRGKYTLDRIDVNGNYSPDNCRWLDMTGQARNRRNKIDITYNGETHTLKEWSDVLGINYDTMWVRYNKGLSVEQIFFK